MLGSKKMSRSLENSFTVGELEEKGYRGKEIRYFLLSSHYRKPLNFSFGALDTARNTIRRLEGFIQRLIRVTPGDGYPETDQLIYSVNRDFTEAMDDDFNISNALAAVFEFVKKVTGPLAEGRLNRTERDKILETMTRLNSVVGIMDFHEEQLSEKAQDLLDKRNTAREARNWAESDRLREELRKLGITVLDTPEGTIWKKE